VNPVARVFATSRVLLPVIHPIGCAEALQSIRIAHEVGVKGVFLINQGRGRDDVLALVREARERFPSLWVGVNLLGYSPPDALRAALDACDGRLDGLWSDSADIDEHSQSQPDADEFLAVRKERGWSGLYFGGVAFKYQRAVAEDDYGTAARTATRYMDVVCTSGPETARAAHVDKLVAMRGAIGPDAALALASGVTADNVSDYLPHVDAFLVGTWIEERFGVLSREKLSRLHDVIHRPAGVPDLAR
jgi:uncharacterized protein